MPSRSARLALRVAGALSLAALAAAIPVLAMVHVPAYTRVLSSAVSGPRPGGLPRPIAMTAAEDVRRVVAGAPESILPDRVGGRAGFGPDERSHLADVRDVVALAAWIALAASLGCAGWLALARRAGPPEARSALVGAGAILLGAVVLAAVAGLTDFEWLFARFHGVFFDTGTWQFPYDSLLVQLFPEGFWAVSAAVWAAFCAGAGVGMIALGRRHRPQDV